LKYRRLGKTELLVSEIGLGTAQLGGPSLIAGKLLGSPKITKKESLKILNLAYDAGINFFDTSDKYGDGQAERLLAEAFSKKRRKIILATKCGFTSLGNRRFDQNYIRVCLNRSLKNLKTDCLDIFQMNKPPLDVIASGRIYEIFHKLKNEGKIRFSGVSSGKESETLKLIADNKIDTLQIFYNLLYIRPNDSLVGNIARADIGLIVRSPLSGGVLSRKFSYDTKFSPEDDRGLFLHGKVLADRIDAINRIKKYFKLKGSKDILFMALNYLLSNKRVSTIIPGVSKSSQLDDILEVTNIRRFGQKRISEIENFIRDNYKG